jgi:hypothetical protein
MLGVMLIGYDLCAKDAGSTTVQYMEEENPISQMRILGVTNCSLSSSFSALLLLYFYFNLSLPSKYS